MRPSPSHLLLLWLCLAAVQSLKCRVEKDTTTQEEFEDIVRHCIREENEFHRNQQKNNNYQEGWRRQYSSQNKSDERRHTTEKYEKGDEDYSYDYDNENNGRDKSHKPQRDLNGKHNKYQNNQTNKQFNSNRGQGSSNPSNNLGSPLEYIEPCIIHCIFKYKKMLNKRDYIDKSNTIHVLTNKIRSSQLREFIEDSVNECMDELDIRNNEDKCEETKHFALCLEEKGKENCDDWYTSNKNKNSNNEKYNSNEDKNYYSSSQGQYNNNRNRDKSGSGLSYGNRDNNRQNRYSNNRYNSNDRQNSSNNYNQNRDRNRNYNYSSERQNNRGEGSQNDDGDEEKIKFPSSFQSRG